MIVYIVSLPFRSTQILMRSGKKSKMKRKEFLAITRYGRVLEGTTSDDGLFLTAHVQYHLTFCGQQVSIISFFFNKETLNTLIMLQKVSNSKNAFLLNVLFIKES